jgi:ubiquinone/menaquinone biosynthesis C-methylase UbiE
MRRQACLSRTLLVHAGDRVLLFDTGAFANIRFTQGDASSLPFPDASFDAALLVLVLGGVPDQDRCIAEVARMLVHGGCVTSAGSEVTPHIR